MNDDTVQADEATCGFLRRDGPDFKTPGASGIALNIVESRTKKDPALLWPQEVSVPEARELVQLCRPVPLYGTWTVTSAESMIEGFPCLGDGPLMFPKEDEEQMAQACVFPYLLQST